MASAVVKNVDIVESGQPESSFIDSYNVIGLLANGTYGEVVLASSKDQGGNLYAVKILRNTEENDLARELFTLKLILECLRSSTAQSYHGVLFLQRFREIFQDGEHVHFLVLEYHPAALSDPDVAYRFRLTKDSHFGLSPSVSLPVTSTCPSVSTRPHEEIVQSVRLLAAEISLGLAFLHDRGLVHQDIKPANILFSYSGHVIIGDFGATSGMPLSSSARLGPPRGVRTSQYDPIVLNADDTITFTPLYAAPELRERTSDGLVVYDDRSDWWSLGILLYELVTGTVPLQTISGVGNSLGGRRSDGDCSLTFGELEALSRRLKACHSTWYPDMESFLRSLLSHCPDDRLTWPDIKDHKFMRPLQEIWEDIADLKYPPCPDPPTSRVYTERPTVEEEVEEPIMDSLLDRESGTSEEQWTQCKFSSNGLFSSLSVSLVNPREPHQLPSLHSQFSDDANIPEALPSSASIWIFENTQDTNFDVDFGSIALSEVSKISTSSMGSHEYSTSTQVLRSPFSLTAINDPYRCLQSDFRSDTCGHVEHRSAYGEFITPEDLTWSMLEAMDEQERGYRGQRRQQHTYRKSRKVVKSFTRILERMFFSR
ncbi:hypothetical protein H0H87_012363 [Tephrocybe sp. NHM501043]|nr:hypothetical protein H0H87_012363 [Tephrocybe sp. NHM501043]